MSDEKNLLIVKEEVVLEKKEDGVVVERITIVNGEIVGREVFNNANEN